MGRKRTVIVDDDQLLAGIERDIREQTAAAKELSAKALENRDFCAGSSGHWPLTELTNYGARIDFPYWLGHDPTPTERLRAQQAFTRLEERGFIRVYGRRATAVRMTDAGLEYLAQLQQQQGAATDGQALAQ
ncbi:MAG TPA: hypothetical protein VL175_12540 [Pirellulales bacterium]|jgi:hypothetical protein|nr:hypothetical protein [Pirellulales bacterium]